MAAALFMARTKTAIRLIAGCTPEHALSLREIVARLNDELCRDNPHAMFVALVLCVIDCARALSSGVTPSAAALHRGGERRIEPRNEAIGCPLGLPVSDGYAIGATTIAAGTSVFQHRRHHGSGEPGGGCSAICAWPRRWAPRRSARRKICSSAVLGAVTSFCADTEPADDVAALVCRFKP